MTINRTKGYIVIFAICSILLLGVAFNSYVQSRKLDHYAIELSRLGHHIIHLRDDIILSASQGMATPYIYTAELVGIERKITEIRDNYHHTSLIPQFHVQGDLTAIIDEYHLCTTTLTDFLDKMIGVSVAKESTLMSLRAILEEKTGIEHSDLPLNNVLVELINHSINDTGASYFQFKDIFNDLDTQQAQIYTVLLSEDSVAFVEATEHQINLMLSDYRDMKALYILIFIGLLIVFILLSGRERLAELKKNSIEIEQERDKAEKANQAKSLFLATMSHELRTPMNGVLGVAEMLQLESQDPETKKQAQVIIDSGQHLVTLLNDILDFSKVEEGKMTLEVVEFSLPDVILHIEKVLRPLAVNKNIELNIVNCFPETERFHGDSSRFRQILFNLIGNAIKFTQQGKVDVEFSSSNERLKVVVSDTGVGIAADKIKTIFSPFEQAENSTTRKFGGTGLGLSIVKKLTELMGGDIKVFSRENVGSQFVVILPIEMTKGENEIKQPLLEEKAAPVNLQLKILIVEDNVVNAMVAKRFCEKEGYSVEHCVDAIDAIEKLKYERFDLILMDNHMPGMKGCDAIKVIRQELKVKTVIFACTADVFQEAHDEFLVNGANFVLTKPLQLNSLNQAIAQFEDEITLFGTQKLPENSNVVHLLRYPPEKLVMTEEEISHSPYFSADRISQSQDLLESVVTEFDCKVDQLIDAYSNEDITSLIAILVAIKGSAIEFNLIQLLELTEKLLDDGESKGLPDLVVLQKLINRLLVNSHQASRLLERNSQQQISKE